MRLAADPKEIHVEQISKSRLDRTRTVLTLRTRGRSPLIAGENETSAFAVSLKLAALANTNVGSRDCRYPGCRPVISVSKRLGFRGQSIAECGLRNDNQFSAMTWVPELATRPASICV